METGGRGRGGGTLLREAKGLSAVKWAVFLDTELGMTTWKIKIFQAFPTQLDLFSFSSPLLVRGHVYGGRWAGLFFVIWMILLCSGVTAAVRELNNSEVGKVITNSVHKSQLWYFYQRVDTVIKHSVHEPQLVWNSPVAVSFSGVASLRILIPRNRARLH